MVVAHTFSFGAWKAEAGGSLVSSKPAWSKFRGYKEKTLFSKSRKKKYFTVCVCLGVCLCSCAPLPKEFTEKGIRFPGTEIIITNLYVGALN